MLLVQLLIKIIIWKTEHTEEMRDIVYNNSRNIRSAGKKNIIFLMIIIILAINFKA